jgi:hypothetical protein
MMFICIAISIPPNTTKYRQLARMRAAVVRPLTLLEYT